MELNDTIDLMNSSDYKERFKAEYMQVKIRYEKLKSFCNKIESAEITGKEPPKLDCPVSLLRDQQRAMGNYLHILELRAEIENIQV